MASSPPPRAKAPAHPRGLCGRRLLPAGRRHGRPAPRLAHGVNESPPHPPAYAGGLYGNVHKSPERKRRDLSSCRAAPRPFALNCLHFATTLQELFRACRCTLLPDPRSMPLRSDTQGLVLGLRRGGAWRASHDGRDWLMCVSRITMLTKLGNAWFSTSAKTIFASFAA